MNDVLLLQLQLIQQQLMQQQMFQAQMQQMQQQQQHALRQQAVVAKLSQMDGWANLSPVQQQQVSILSFYLAWISQRNFIQSYN